MKSEVDIVYTQTFLATAERVVDFLTPELGNHKSVSVINHVVERLEKRVLEHPVSCQVSPALIELGVTAYREYNIETFRVLYRSSNDQQKIFVLALLHQKQDIKKLFHDIALLRNLH
ncbi:type II toxin-antitoxin system RelE/ParE family toxin [Endozoicomonas numazuensis]|uniref:type II toxin-antitoxin system RelE/ParE family toxin n=1 Tax=Endozoicomonas numazuensis TaxID=1137799 RepID=UPI0006918EA0|nr:type II toxin-antitoxin system RelE/ParE family toxin [Endozoicomonas numazuensis]